MISTPYASHFTRVAGLLLAATTFASAAAEDDPRLATNRFRLPVSQILTPAGKQVLLPRMRPQALALSPDGRRLVTAGKTHDLVVIDPATGAIEQTVPLPTTASTENPAVSTHLLNPDKDAQLSF